MYSTVIVAQVNAALAYAQSLYAAVARAGGDVSVGAGVGVYAGGGVSLGAGVGVYAGGGGRASVTSCG